MHNPRRQRPRGHHNNHNGGSRRNNNGAQSGFYNRNQTFDSNGPEVRIRGTAQQVYEKYLNTARDAAAAGDNIRAESLLQHAEHYFRILASIQENWQAQNEQPRMENFSASENTAENGEQPQIQYTAPNEQASLQNDSMEQAQHQSRSQRSPRHRVRNGYIPPKQPISDEQPSLTEVPGEFSEEFTESTDRAAS